MTWAGAVLKILRLSDGSERVVLPQIEIHCRIRSWEGDRLLISGQLLDRSVDVYEVSAESGRIRKVTTGEMPLRTGVSAAAGGHEIAYVAQEEERFPEVVTESPSASKAARLTDYHAQVEQWPKFSQRTVTWPHDGCNIQGVLIDARGNSKGDRHPLIVLLHGGPASTNAYPTFLHSYFELGEYPIRQWHERGLSIFVPDYRGSSGYGLALPRRDHAIGGESWSAATFCAVWTSCWPSMASTLSRSG